MVFIFACERLTFHGRPRSLHGHVLWTWGCFVPEWLDVSNRGPSFAKLAGFICQQIMFKTIMITFSLSPNEFRKAHGFISQLKALHLLYEHQSFVVSNASIPAFLLCVQPYSSSAVWPFENSLRGLAAANLQLQEVFELFRLSACPPPSTMLHHLAFKFCAF